MTKEKYMALADFQTVWTNSIKPWIVAGFIAVTAVEAGATPKLVLQDGTLLAQSTFQPAGDYVLASEKGANGGVATLGADGKVPASQLPSFVDDVLEFASEAAFPAQGEGGKIFVALDNNKTFRWGGSTYVEISAGLALGETQGTAYEGSKGKKNADDIADLQADKADKVTGATNGNFAGLDTNGNLTDSGKKAADFATAEQGAKADTAIQGVSINGQEVTPDASKKINLGENYVQDANYVHTDSNYTAAEKTKLAGIAEGAQVNVIETVKVNGVALTPDAQKAVNVEFEIPERVTAEELAAFVV
jgi:Cu/Ag efflux protein CusF